MTAGDAAGVAAGDAEGEGAGVTSGGGVGGGVAWNASAIAKANTVIVIRNFGYAQRGLRACASYLYTMGMVAFTNEQAEALLERIVASHNAGARTGDFSPFVALFTADAIMEFEGVPDWGPFTGRDAIARRLAADPPDDEIHVTRWRFERGTIVAEFRWSDIPEASGGCFIVEPRDEHIARLTIAFGGPHRRFR